MGFTLEKQSFGFYMFGMNPNSKGFLSVLCMIAAEPGMGWGRQANPGLLLQPRIWQESRSQMQGSMNNKPKMRRSNALCRFVWQPSINILWSAFHAWAAFFTCHFQ